MSHFARKLGTTAYWAIDTGDGDQLTTGISSEVVARRIARRMADDRGESVYLYEVVAGADPETEVDSEEISPTQALRERSAQ